MPHIANENLSNENQNETQSVENAESNNQDVKMVDEVLMRCSNENLGNKTRMIHCLWKILSPISKK